MAERSRVFRRSLLAAMVSCVTWFVGTNAHAQEGALRTSIDWSRLAAALRDGDGFFLPRESLTVGAEGKPQSASSSGELRWFGLSPHVSLVARDWGGAQLLVGHLAVTDQFRLSRSSRMVVTRVRLADGRFSPFAQIGVGQWRVDTDLMPVLPRDVELASQLGGGFEATLWQHATAALEADYTALYREGRAAQAMPGPHLWGCFLVARASF
ncbi:MAG: porin family protein [Myxococcota bacterium]|nr:porin family protein [Myxococcota bacterium]